jgi:excisionase family DNA binding protein
MTLLTVDQAAERLATKPRFIRRLIAERRIPYVKLGSHVRIDTTDLDAFVAAGRAQSTARQLRLGYPQSAH